MQNAYELQLRAVGVNHVAEASWDQRPVCVGCQSRPPPCDLKLVHCIHRHIGQYFHGEGEFF